MFETIIKGGRVIDPATGHDGVADIATNRGKIVAIDKNL
jgi:dihydroorotase